MSKEQKKPKITKEKSQSSYQKDKETPSKDSLVNNSNKKKK